MLCHTGDTSLRTDGFGSLLSNAKLNVTGKLSVDANGYDVYNGGGVWQ